MDVRSSNISYAPTDGRRAYCGGGGGLGRGGKTVRGPVKGGDRGSLAS